MLITFVFLIAAIVHNTIRYVIMQKRLAFHLWYFYFVALFISLLRCFIFTYFLYFVTVKAKQDKDTRTLTQIDDRVYVVDCVTTYGAMILGLSWCCSLQELSTLIRMSELIKKYDG